MDLKFGWQFKGIFKARFFRRSLGSTLVAESFPLDPAVLGVNQQLLPSFEDKPAFLGEDLHYLSPINPAFPKVSLEKSGNFTAGKTFRPFVLFFYFCRFTA